MKLDGYVRVSRIGGREGEGYISPDVQRDTIAAYATELGGEMVAWHDDQDYSGGSADRPGFQRVIERLEAGETDGVVVMKIDRFARSTADGYRIITEIIGREQVFASCHERIDPRTPEGKFMLRAFLSNGELFLDQSKASWWTAKSRAIARGVHIGPTPVGYLKVEAVPSKPTHISPVDAAALGGPTAPGMLVPSPTHGPAMSKLYARCATRQQGDTALARWFTEEAPRKTGAPWQPSEIRRWLKSRVYLGEVHYGELVNIDAHEPLTDSATWERCQREPGVQRRAASTFLLSGLLRCAACRYSMGGFSRGGAKHDTPVYRCIRGSKGCPEPSVIVAARIEGYVVGVVKDAVAGTRLEAVRSGVDIEEVEREAAEAGDEVTKFVGDVDARRLLGEVEWRKGMEARVANRDARFARRDAVHAQHRLATLSQDVEGLDRQALRDLLQGMVRHIFVRRVKGGSAEDRTLIVPSTDARQVDVPRPHVSGPFDPIRW